MTGFEWVAIVGAGAWIPIVGKWINQYFAKPVIRVSPTQAPELGYTTFGPIINFTCAISASRKDAVIENLTAQLIHEKGQVIEFRWTQLTEPLYEAISPDGFTAATKIQPAVALKISTLEPNGKTIRMQELNFNKDSRAQVERVMEQYSHLEKTEPETHKSLVLKSKEFSDLIAFSKDRFMWQNGNYELRLHLHVYGLRKPSTHTFEFTLNKGDFGLLRRNLDEIERYVSDLIQPPGEEQKYNWNWANPPFEETAK